MNNEKSTPEQDEKILIAYYSYSGNTRRAAEMLQGIAGGDIFEIKPAAEYSSSYNACLSRARTECAEKAQPELAKKLESIDKYDVVFVGTPNWCNTMAPPVLSFLCSYDFSGKTVVPFLTHGGGGAGHCEKDIQQACSGAKFARCAAFPGAAVENSASAMKKWVSDVLEV